MPGPAQTDQPPPEDTVARTTSGATSGRPGLTSRNNAWRLASSVELQAHQSRHTINKLAA